MCGDEMWGKYDTGGSFSEHFLGEFSIFFCCIALHSEEWYAAHEL